MESYSLEAQKEKDLKGAEYISGFSKDDYLRAVITLVVYFGSKPWDGAKDLHSLIDWTGMPEDLRKVIPNYSIYLLELNKYEHLDDFKSDLRTVCRFLQSSEDDKKLEAMLTEHREEFEDMAEDTYDLIGAFGNMESVNKLKEECRKEDGGYNMCKGMEDWLKRKEEEGRSEGRSEGRNEMMKALIETCREFGASREDTLTRITDKFQMDEVEAEEYLVRYWE